MIASSDLALAAAASTAGEHRSDQPHIASARRLSELIRAQSGPHGNSVEFVVPNFEMPSKTPASSKFDSIRPSQEYSRVS